MKAKAHTFFGLAAVFFAGMTVAFSITYLIVVAS